MTHSDDVRLYKRKEHETKLERESRARANPEEFDDLPEKSGESLLKEVGLSSPSLAPIRTDGHRGAERHIR